MRNGKKQRPRSGNHGGAQPDKSDKDAWLFWAAGRGAPHDVEQALKAGGNVNYAGFQGLTPLHLAATRGCLESLRLLLAAGANLCARGGRFGATPLHGATAVASPAITLALVEAG